MNDPSQSIVTSIRDNNGNYKEPVNVTILDHFKFLWETDKRYIALCGGGGSAKSHTMCQKICHLFLSVKNCYFAIVRENMTSLRRTVYKGNPSIMKTLSDWGIPASNWLNGASNTLINPYNHNEMYFIGVYDPERIKSLNLNFVWIDEATLLNVDKFSQLDLRCRNAVRGVTNQMFLSYNPVSYYNWAVQMFVVNPDDFIKENSIVSFSNFTQNPFVRLEDVLGWLNKAKKSEAYYRTYILGEPSKPVGQIYSDFKPIPSSMWPEEVWKCEARYGIDWGYVDPMTLVEVRRYNGSHYVRCLYCKTRRFTKDLVRFMKRIGVPSDAVLYCDSAEIDRIDTLRAEGYTNAGKAIKNLNAGISYVQGENIIYDPTGKNGRMFTEEVQGYCYMVDPNDENGFLDKPEPGNEHILDGARYGIFTWALDDGIFEVGGLDISIGDRMEICAKTGMDIIVKKEDEEEVDEEVEDYDFDDDDLRSL